MSKELDDLKSRIDDLERCAEVISGAIGGICGRLGAPDLASRFIDKLYQNKEEDESPENQVLGGGGGAGN